MDMSDESTRAEQEALASVMERVREHDEAREVASERSKPKQPFLARPTTTIGSVLVLIGVLIFNAVQLNDEPSTQTPEQAAEVARVQAALVGLQVEALRAAGGGRLPAASEVGLGFLSVDYAAAGSGYSLSTVVGGQASRFSEGESPAALLGSSNAGGTP